MRCDDDARVVLMMMIFVEIAEKIEETQNVVHRKSHILLL
jgi:hypothetical protein